MKNTSFKLLILLFFSGFFTISCNNNPGTNDGGTHHPTTDTENRENGDMTSNPDRELDNTTATEGANTSGMDTSMNSMNNTSGNTGTMNSTNTGRTGSGTADSLR